MLGTRCNILHVVVGLILTITFVTLVWSNVELGGLKYGDGHLRVTRNKIGYTSNKRLRIATDLNNSIEERDEAWDFDQSGRRDLIEQQCRHISQTYSFLELSKLAYRRELLHNILVDDTHGTLYCYIPKVACTEWKRLYMIMNGLSNYTDRKHISSQTVHYNSGLDSLASKKFSHIDVMKRLSIYTKFMVVRDPLERLLSAYLDKFHSNTSDAKVFKLIYATKMLQAVRPDQVSSQTGEGMTFEDFLNYLTLQPSETYQEHWRPYMQLCHPCSIEYDYVAHFQSLEEDSNQILKRLKVNDQIKFPPLRSSKSKQLLNRLVTHLQPSLMRKIKNIFMADYKLFGYDTS